MKFDFLERRSAERFAELIDEATTDGHRHHTRGPADEQLAQLVAVGRSLSAARSGVQVDPEFRTGLRAMLVATAERESVGVGIEAEPGAHDGASGRGLLRLTGSGRRIRARGAIVAGVLAGAMAVSGISAASESAAPGDALYGVKRSTERAQLAMAGSDVSRGQLSLDFARTRLAEATAMAGDDGAFGGVLGDMDADIRQGVKLLTGAAVAHRNTGPLGTIEAFVTSERTSFAPALGRLGPADAARALISVALLDAVHRRTESLRAGLACPSPEVAGADELGPMLAACTDGTEHRTTSVRPQGGAGKQARVGTGGSGTPRPSRSSSTTPRATASPRAVPDASPTDPRADDPPDDPLPYQSALTDESNPHDSDGVSGGGLLGGILQH